MKLREEECIKASMIARVSVIQVEETCLHFTPTTLYGRFLKIIFFNSIGKSDGEFSQK